MKKILIPIILSLFVLQVNAQGGVDPTTGDRVITTAVPFMLIAGDARSAGMADMGVATSADAFSQQWNASKYAFAISKQGVGVTYTPYLSSLVNDIFLGNLVYYNRLNEQSAVAVNLRYFSLGEIELLETPDQQPLIVKPNEMLFDVSYSLRLSERIAMAVTGRYIRSDLKIPSSFDDKNVANTFAVDISGYYQSEEIAYSDFDGRWRAGMNISNIGPKLKYEETGSESNLPTNLAIGLGFDFILDEYNKVGLTGEVNKLLVPTPQDFDNDGDIDGEDDDVYDDISFFSGIFKSFGDAPDGFSEELKEFTWALGAEYMYQDSFSFRTGYFNESDEKGSRKFLSIGAGFKYTSIAIDVSYLFSTSKIKSPLEGSLRFGLTFNFGDEYDEY